MNADTAIYGRTSKEVNDAYSVSSQIDNCVAYANQHNLSISNNYVFGEDFTGTLADRPELNKLKKLIQQHKIRHLIINTTDRLARKTSVGETLLDELFNNNVTLHIVQWGTCVTSSPSDRLRFSIESTFASYERAQIVERTQRGKAKKAQSGKIISHSKAPYGYEYNEYRDGFILSQYAPYVKELLIRYGMLHENPTAICNDFNERNIPTPGSIWADQLEEIAKKLYRNGNGMIKKEDYEAKMTHAAHMRGYGKWNVQVIHTILKHVWDYTGEYHFNWQNTEYVAEVPPIITEEIAVECDKFRNVCNQRYRHGRNEGKSSKALMARRLVCECGYSIVAKPKESLYFSHYYTCQTRDRAARVGIEVPNCGNKPVRNDVLDPMGVDFVRTLLLHPDLMFRWWEQQQEHNDDVNSDIHNKIAYIDEKLAEKRKKLTRTLDRLTDELDDDEIDFYTQQKTELKKSIIEYEEDRRNLEDAIVVTTVPEVVVRSYAEMGEELRFELEEVQPIEFWRGLIDDLDITGKIGNDNNGQYIDFVVFGLPRKRAYMEDVYGNNSDMACDDTSRKGFSLTVKVSQDMMAELSANLVNRTYTFRYYIPDNNERLIPITTLFGKVIAKEIEPIAV